MAYTPENYLSQYLKKHFLEKLVKEGFHKLVSRAMDSWYGEQMIKGTSKNATEVKNSEQ